MRSPPKSYTCCVQKASSQKSAGNPRVNTSHTREQHVPAPPVSDGLVVPDGLAAGEQVRMLPVDDFQIISAAHFHLFRLFLEQDLAAQLVKHDGVHLGPAGPPSPLQRWKLHQKGKRPRRKEGSPRMRHSVPASLLRSKRSFRLLLDHNLKSAVAISRSA